MKAVGAHTSICRRLALICLGSIKLSLVAEDGTDKALTNSAVFDRDCDFATEIFAGFYGQPQARSKQCLSHPCAVASAPLPPWSDQPGSSLDGLGEVFGRAPFSALGSPP